MMAGRPKKPLGAKLLAGTYRADRDGPADAQVRAAGVPVPPEDLAGEALAYWHRIVPGLVASGVAAACDSEALGLMCWWLDQLRLIRNDVAKLRSGGTIPGQLYVQAGIATDKFGQLAARFGLTPSDRARLRVEPAAPPATPVAPRRR